MKILATLTAAACLSMILEASGPSSGADFLPREAPGASLPVAREYHYKMAGRVRALLLWVGRDNVGSGVIRWRGTGADRAFELLIGSDPQRAPGGLNKWGYLAEQIQGSNCTVFGVISKSAEDGPGDVRASLQSKPEGRPFNAIRGRVMSSEAYSHISTIHAPGSLTYRESGTVLDLAFGDSSQTVKAIRRPPGSRPGFLSSVAELIEMSRIATKTGRPLATQQLSYVYGDKVYDLRLTESLSLARFEREGRIFEDVIRGRFETVLAGERSASRFELVYWGSGAMAGVPILISYQPKWWLQVDLLIQI